VMLLRLDSNQQPCETRSTTAANAGRLQSLAVSSADLRDTPSVLGRRLRTSATQSGGKTGALPTTTPGGGPSLAPATLSGVDLVAIISVIASATVGISGAASVFTVSTGLPAPHGQLRCASESRTPTSKYSD
jgi:hypothetical protein